MKRKQIIYMDTYKVYTALFKQTGTDVPQVIVLKNTIGNIVWTRLDVGTYHGTLIGAFPAGKTFMPPWQMIDTLYCTVERLSDDLIKIETVVGVNSTDGMLGFNGFASSQEIRVYP